MLLLLFFEKDMTRKRQNDVDESDSDSESESLISIKKRLLRSKLKNNRIKSPKSSSTRDLKERDTISVLFEGKRYESVLSRRLEPRTNSVFSP